MNAIYFPDILVISYHTARKPQNVVHVPLGWRLIKLQAREWLWPEHSGITFVRNLYTVQKGCTDQKTAIFILSW